MAEAAFNNCDAELYLSVQDNDENYIQVQQDNDEQENQKCSKTLDDDNYLILQDAVTAPDTPAKITATTNTNQRELKQSQQHDDLSDDANEQMGDDSPVVRPPLPLPRTTSVATDKTIDSKYSHRSNRTAAASCYDSMVRMS